MRAFSPLPSGRLAWATRTVKIVRASSRDDAYQVVAGPRMYRPHLVVTDHHEAVVAVRERDVPNVTRRRVHHHADRGGVAREVLPGADDAHVAVRVVRAVVGAPVRAPA